MAWTNSFVRATTRVGKKVAEGPICNFDWYIKILRKRRNLKDAAIRQNVLFGTDRTDIVPSFERIPGVGFISKERNSPCYYLLNYVCNVVELRISSIKRSLHYGKLNNMKICHNAGIPGEVCILFDKSSQKHRCLYSNPQIFFFSSTFLSK
ncbi:MAG: hypothetical protein GY777_19345 [Candidatus Brocadiaceae bacterium]|nr:hypothetical protein [Candidatus Brocadiaceae bacterium]